MIHDVSHILSYKKILPLFTETFRLSFTYLLKFFLIIKNGEGGWRIDENPHQDYGYYITIMVRNGFSSVASLNLLNFVVNYNAVTFCRVEFSLDRTWHFHVQVDFTFYFYVKIPHTWALSCIACSYTRRSSWNW